MDRLRGQAIAVQTWHNDWLFYASVSSFVKTVVLGGLYYIYAHIYSHTYVCSYIHIVTCIYVCVCV
jgi:hypothetical protein